MTLLTRLPTYEYRPPGETHIHWAWGQGPPSASLLPPPPGRPAPAWLSAPVTSTPSSSSAPLGPTSTSSSYPLGPATSSSSDPLGPTSTSSSALLGSAPSSSSAPLGPAATSSSTPLETTSRQPLIVEGHSKVDGVLCPAYIPKLPRSKI